MIDRLHQGLAAALGLAFVAITPVASFAQPSEDLSPWQVEKCEIYRQGWDKALEFFGTDNLNYNFIAQNENFIASGCTAAPSVCAQSSQELEIANALTITMMNQGAASTFLPFRCQSEQIVGQLGSTTSAAPDSELCRAQLDLLLRGHKLTKDEAAIYEEQCACLERNQNGNAPTDCAQ